MALGNLWLERRGNALGTEAMIEILAGARHFAESLMPPSLTATIVVAIDIGNDPDSSAARKMRRRTLLPTTRWFPLRLLDPG